VGPKFGYYHADRTHDGLEKDRPHRRPPSIRQPVNDSHHIPVWEVYTSLLLGKGFFERCEWSYCDLQGTRLRFHNSTMLLLASGDRYPQNSSRSGSKMKSNAPNRWPKSESKGRMEAEATGAVERARSGDNEAFRLLVEQHGRAVFRLAYRMTGNEEDAEDVVQETFLKAYRQINTFDARASFSTWLYRIASNCSLDLIRKRKTRERKRERGQDPDRDVLVSIPAPTPGPDRELYSSQISLCVRAALDELSGQERTAFILRHFEGLSITEIGLALGTGASATKHSIFRAVQKLRRSLEPLVSSPR
jgi:RNA polymerase sigma-70 factor (ECF subfamily)